RETNSLYNGELGLISKNNLDYIIFYLLCSKLNKTFIPLDPDMTIDGFEKILTMIPKSNIFVDKENYQNFKNFPSEIFAVFPLFHLELFVTFLLL
ncbi:MAG: hypothetical protein ACO3OL_14395, partial [bacterium]